MLGIDPPGVRGLRLAPRRHVRVWYLPWGTGRLSRRVCYAWYGLTALMLALWWRPDWVYASDPSVCPIVLWVTRLTRRRLVYHEHDAPDESAPRVIRWARAEVAARADLCVVPNAGRAILLGAAAGGKDRCTVVMNCPCDSEVATARRPYEGGPLWLLFYGSIGPQRLPETILDAMAMLPSCVHLRVAGYETEGTRGYVQRYRERASDLRIEDRLEVIGLVPHHDLMPLATRCHVGLSLMPM
ncbi:MAG: glycosyltransferase family protein, partial [Candidatus Xenobia bacterium]